MSWVKLDDQFFSHPKVIRAGRDARDLYLASLTYAAGQRTDGAIPSQALRLLGGMADIDDPQAGAKRLVEVGLWQQVDTGYEIHDYLKYNPSRERVEEIRAERAEAGRTGGFAKAANESAEQESSKSLANGLANDLANGQLNPAPSPSPSPAPSPSPRDNNNTREAAETAALGALFTQWGQMVGNLTDMDREKVLDAVNEYGTGELKYAFDQAHEHHAYKWAYVRAVLKDRGNPARASPSKPVPIGDWIGPRWG